MPQPARVSYELNWKLENGATVIMHARLDDPPWERVLAVWGNEFVVWTVHAVTNHAHSGHYFQGTPEGLESALKCFKEGLK